MNFILKKGHLFLAAFKRKLFKADNAFLFPSSGTSSSVEDLPGGISEEEESSSI